MAYERTDITHFALVASDSDFRHLVFKLLDLWREVLGFGESKSDNDFAGFLLLLLKAPELKIQEKIQNKVDKGEQDEFLKALIWACAGFDGFAEINKINSKMIAHFGKDWGIRKTSFKSWARFFKLYSVFFDICYKDKKSTPSVRLKKRSF